MAFFSFRSTLSRCFCFFPYISMPNLHLRHRHQPQFDPSSPRQILQTILHPSQSHLLPSPQLLPDTPTHTLGTIKNHEYSSTLLAFCGSRHVSSVLESAVVLVWRDTNIMDFKSECHGPSYKPGKGAGDTTTNSVVGCGDAESVMSLTSMECHVLKKSKIAPYANKGWKDESTNGGMMMVLPWERRLRLS